MHNKYVFTHVILFLGAEMTSVQMAATKCPALNSLYVK